MPRWIRSALPCAIIFLFCASQLGSMAQKQARPAAQPLAARPGQPKAQKIDAEYTAKSREYLQDPRISTELVDHLPASDTVPTPLKFFGRIPGTPGELTYSSDINRYYEALDKASE